MQLLRLWVIFEKYYIWDAITHPYIKVRSFYSKLYISFSFFYFLVFGHVHTRGEDEDSN